MNFKQLLLAATLVSGACASAAAVAVSPDPLDARTNTVPTPVKIVNPTAVPRRFESETIRVGFTVDVHGRVRNLQLLAPRDPVLEKRLLPALAEWQFSPAQRNGRAVAVNVVLPLQLVDETNP